MGLLERVFYGAGVREAENGRGGAMVGRGRSRAAGSSVRASGGWIPWPREAHANPADRPFLRLPEGLRLEPVPGWYVGFDERGRTIGVRPHRCRSPLGPQRDRLQAAARTGRESPGAQGGPQGRGEGVSAEARLRFQQLGEFARRLRTTPIPSTNRGFTSVLIHPRNTCAAVTGSLPALCLTFSNNVSGTIYA